MQQMMIRAIDARWQVRLIVVTATSMVQTVQRHQRLSPVATAALGRVMIGAALLAGYIKPVRTQRIQIHVHADGPLQEVMAECTGDGLVRGYVRNPSVMLPLRDGKWDVAKAVGRGTMTVIRDFGFGEPYVSTVPLVNGEIGADLAHYLFQSEQVHSAVLLGVLIRRQRVMAAGGCLVERLPSAREEDMDRLSARIARLGSISRWFWHHPEPAALLRALFPDGATEILETRRLRFRCRCNVRRVRAMLRALETRWSFRSESPETTIEVQCRFCRRTYRFPVAEIVAHHRA